MRYAGGLPRREFVSGMLSAAGLAAVAPRIQAPGSENPALGDGLVIQPREAWGAGLPPLGPLEQEGPGDVRVLLVHHTAETNSYQPGDVVGILRDIYGFHTGSKGWDDVAYNFFVDRFGRVWEGRTGSMNGPVIGDATGGNQGFSQLCCYMGHHSVEPPTAPAYESMVRLVAALADRYEVPTARGSLADFVSRGSNKFPEGSRVVVPTISGHRDVSETECPGEAAYKLVVGSMPEQVTAARLATVVATTATTAVATSAAPPPTTTTSAPVPTNSTSSTAPEGGAGNEPREVAAAETEQGPGDSPGPWLGGAAAACAALLGLGYLVRRRSTAGGEPGGDTPPSDL